MAWLRCGCGGREVVVVIFGVELHVRILVVCHVGHCDRFLPSYSCRRSRRLVGSEGCVLSRSFWQRTGDKMSLAVNLFILQERKMMLECGQRDELRHVFNWSLRGIHIVHTVRTCGQDWSCRVPRRNGRRFHMECWWERPHAYIMCCLHYFTNQPARLAMAAISIHVLLYTSRYPA